MKIVIQRTKESKVQVDNEVVGAISKGMVLLVCCEKGDEEATVIKAAEKVSKLRIFQDPETGKMNQDIVAHGGEFLAISQFTLSWDGQKGNRPGFDRSLEPDKAEVLFNKFCEILKEVAPVATGQFGAMMEVSILNDGPVTFSLSF